MKNFLEKYWLFIVLGVVFCLPATAFSFTATARVDRTQVGPGEAVAFRVTVDGGNGEVDLSPITDFEVVPSGTQNMTQWINGKLSRQIVYRYMLMPKRSGDLVIPALAVEDGDERAMTREFRIHVGAGSGAGGGPQAYFARAELQDTETVTGQQTVYTLKLYVAREFAGASFDPPGFEGLTAAELTQWKKYRENVDGRTYMVNETRFMVQGETPGTFEIAPAGFTLKIPVARSGRSSDPFDSFFNDSFFNTTPTKPVRLVSNPVTLKVSPLPEYRGKIPYSGLVGIFNMAAGLDKAKMAAGESATLTVTIQGRGNIMDAAMPALNLPDKRFKIYDDSPKEEIGPTEYGFAGKKIFKRALVPNAAGDVTVGPLSLVYYHVGEKRYKTVSTPPIPLKVVPGEPATLVQTGSGEADSGLPDTDTGVKQAVVLKNKDILDIRGDLSAIRPDDPLPTVWFLSLVLLPGFGFAGFSGILRYRGREKSVAERNLEKARADLASAEQSGTNSPEFLGFLQSALTSALLAKSGKEGAALTRAEARRILEESAGGGLKAAQLEDGAAAEVLQVMDTLDGARFGGAAVDKDTAGRCLSAVRSFIKTLVVVLCLVPAAALWPGKALAQDPARLFIDGTRAYQAGDFDGAAEKFEAVAGSGIKNPDLFYNLGNTYLKSGDLGRAVLWYERARRLAPGDPDLNFNLAHALTQVKDKVDDGFALREILFFWQGLVSLKWLQYLSIGISFVFFAWAGVRRAWKKRVFSGGGVGLALIFCLCLSAAGLEAYRLDSEHLAVILNKTVAVKSGTMENATPLFDLHAGTRVRVLDRRDDHFKIRFAKGKVGWIGGSEAEII